MADSRRLKAMLLLLPLLTALVATGCGRQPVNLGEVSLGIHEYPPPSDYGRGKLEAVPSYDPSSTDVWQVDLRSYDLRALDVSGRLDDLLQADFDTRTQWPASLPSPFDPAKIMALGANPGLGVRSLHEQGITGRGVGVAIIDQALLVSHVEYADRLRYYEEVHCQDSCAQMHGPTVASILVGKTAGVAPEAELYYIAETHGTFRSGGFDWDFTYLAQSIDRLLQANELLPAEGKIRVISISVGWGGGDPAWTAPRYPTPTTSPATAPSWAGAMAGGAPPPGTSSSCPCARARRRLRTAKTTMSSTVRAGGVGAYPISPGSMPWRARSRRTSPPTSSGPRRWKPGRPST